MAQAVSAPTDPPTAPTTGLWTFDVSRGHPGRLALIGTSLGALFLTAWLVSNALDGPGFDAGRIVELPGWGANSRSEALIRTLLLGYSVCIGALGLRSAERELRALRPVLRGGERAFEGVLAMALTPSRRTLHSAGALGIALLLPLSVALGQEALQPFFLGGLAWMALFGWLLVRAVAAHLHVARAFSRIGARDVELDLLDLAPLAPLARWGVRTVLLWTIWFSLVALFWVGPGPMNWENGLGLVPLFVIAVGALVVPVHGVHRRILAAKQAELARLRTQIRAALADPSGAGGGSALPHLVAHQTLIERVREWPLDVSSLARAGFYVALGVGSWICAALVERLLGVALG